MYFQQKNVSGDKFGTILQSTGVLFVGIGTWLQQEAQQLGFKWQDISFQYRIDLE